MSDPKRLRDDFDFPFERGLLRAADVDRAPEGAENKAIEALGLGLAATVAVVARTSTAAPALASSKAGALVALKWIGVAIVAGSLSVLGIRAFAPHREIAAPVSAAPTPPHAPPAHAPIHAVAQEAVPTLTTQKEEESPVANAFEIDDAPKSLAPVAQKSAPVASGNTLNAELQMIDRARKAIAAHDATAASVALDDYARTFPNGALREEAGVARIEALLEGGKSERALREGDLFNARYPDSAYQKTVAALKKRALLMEMGKSAAP